MKWWIRIVESTTTRKVVHGIVLVSSSRHLWNESKTVVHGEYTIGNGDGFRETLFKSAEDLDRSQAD